ncbi:MAG: LemA family protein, partial [Elusimicrobiaceae bacterium]|nr:LemA family protein [Elusimicrobiaceae bacterium]
MNILLVVIILAVVVGLYIMGLYNTLVRMRNSVKEAWSDIEVQLKRRFDLIPNVLSTVKGYAK